MGTEVYFMRHSKPLKFDNNNSKDSLQLKNEKNILSMEGEILAREISEIDEFRDFDVVVSSNYVRAMGTAKYFLKQNELIIMDGFGERRHGVDSYSELPSDFEMLQFNNFNYKIDDGESLNEVKARMLNFLLKVVDKYRGSKILIISHATAMASLFSVWCEVNYSGSYYYNGEEFFDGNWKYCETFKFFFDDNNELLDIVNINLDKYRRSKNV